MLGSGFPGYVLYRASEGYVALAALEPHFWKPLLQELGVKGGERRGLERIFEIRTAEQWEEWAAQRDIPLGVVKEAQQDGTAFASEYRPASTRGEDEQ